MPDEDARLAALGLVIELGLLLDQDFRGSLGELGITTNQANLLWRLGEHGPLRQRDLAEALAVSPRTVTELVDGLTELGLAHRQPHPQDRRAVLVTLTGGGEDLVARFRRQQGEFADLLFADLPADRFTGFVAGLDHVVAQLRSAVRP